MTDIAARLASALAGRYVIERELKPLFDVTGFVHPGFHRSYDVTRDGRFLFERFRSGAGPVNLPLVQVTDWFADIRARTRQ